VTLTVAKLQEAESLIRVLHAQGFGISSYGLEMFRVQPYARLRPEHIERLKALKPEVLLIVRNSEKAIDPNYGPPEAPRVAFTDRHLKFPWDPGRDCRINTMHSFTRAEQMANTCAICEPEAYLRLTAQGVPIGGIEEKAIGKKVKCPRHLKKTKWSWAERLAQLCLVCDEAKFRRMAKQAWVSSEMYLPSNYSGLTEQEQKELEVQEAHYRRTMTAEERAKHEMGDA
jgi:hypothetical protein